MAAGKKPAVTRRKGAAIRAGQLRSRRGRTTPRKSLIRFNLPGIRLIPSRAFAALGLFMIAWQFVARASSERTAQWISADAAGVAGILFLLLAGLSLVLEISGWREG